MGYPRRFHRLPFIATFFECSSSLGSRQLNPHFHILLLVSAMHVQTANGALKLLQRERPAFQLESGRCELPSSEGFFFKRGAASTSGLVRASHALEPATLSFLASIVRPGMTSFETGGGWSTVILATSKAEHVTINPDQTANQLIADFMDAHGIERSGVRFIAGLSDQELPSLALVPLDLVLLDGSHAFPIPIIDWHYAHPNLKVGGRLMLDNSSINAVRMLCDFLMLDANYRFDEQVGDCTVWTKIADNPMVGWGEQLLNRRVFPGYRPVGLRYFADRGKQVARRAAIRMLAR